MILAFLLGIFCFSSFAADVDHEVRFFSAADGGQCVFGDEKININNLFVIDSYSSKLVPLAGLHEDGIRHANFSKNGYRLVTVGKTDNTLKIWQVNCVREQLHVNLLVTHPVPGAMAAIFEDESSETIIVKYIDEKRVSYFQTLCLKQAKY